jgi:hypothetical protein
MVDPQGPGLLACHALFEPSSVQLAPMRSNVGARAPVFDLFEGRSVNVLRVQTFRVYKHLFHK